MNRKTLLLVVVLIGLIAFLAWLGPMETPTGMTLPVRGGS